MHETYNELLNKYISSLYNNCLLFEVTKCCGYSELIPTFKKVSCEDLYNNIYNQFHINKNLTQINVFVYNESKTKLLIPNNNKNIKEFVLENSSFFKPIFKLPSPVVYKIIFEDNRECSTCLSMINNHNVNNLKYCKEI